MNLEAEFLQPDNASPSLDRMKLLVVDDDPDTRMLFTFVFEDNGAEVRAVASVPEALEVINQWQPQLLISDIYMPDEDGNSLIRKVRKLDTEQRHMPAIAVTGFCNAEANYVNASSDYQLHLSKPIDPDELVAAVVNLARQTIFGCTCNKLNAAG